MEALKLKQLKRVRDAEIEAAAAEAAIEELEMEEYERYLAAVQMEEEPVLNDEERAAQALALAELDSGLMDADL